MPPPADGQQGHEADKEEQSGHRKRNQRHHERTGRRRGIGQPHDEAGDPEPQQAAGRYDAGRRDADASYHGGADGRLLLACSVAAVHVGVLHDTGGARTISNRRYLQKRNKSVFFSFVLALRACWEDPMGIFMMVIFPYVRV